MTPRARANATAVLVLGLSTLLVTLAAGASEALYTGVGVVGDQTLGLVAASAVLMLISVVAFVITMRGGRLRRRAGVGLGLAVGAGPATLLLLPLIYTVLQALGIYLGAGG